MKRYNTEDVTDIKLIEKAIDFAAKGKKSRREVAYVLANKQFYINALQKMIINRTFKPSKPRRIEMIDKASGKFRVIYCPPFFPDQCFHHVMMFAAVPVLMKGMSAHVFASVPNRGALYGKRFIRRWLDSDRKNTKYVAKLDIKKFYPSIPHDKLLAKLHSKFKNKDLLYMIDCFVNGHEETPGRGIAIGFYPSQWFSNFYLQDLDHYAKERLGVKYYGRYMDDIVFFGGNKKILHNQMNQIIAYLNAEGLTVKENWQVFRFDYIRKRDGKRCGRDLDFMGFRFYRDKTTLRRRNALRIRRTVKQARKQRLISPHRAASIISYYGWIKHTNSWHYNKKYVGGVVSLTALKCIISCNQRLQNQRAIERKCKLYENHKHQKAAISADRTRDG